MGMVIFEEVIHQKFIEGLNNKVYYNRAIALKETYPSNHQWRCDTYSTYNTSYNMLNDPIFAELLDATTKEVIKFSKEYGIKTEKVKCNTYWINIAEPNAYQEYHIHAGSHFSAVYYVNTPKDCGNIIFKSHKADTEMFELPIENYTLPSYSTYAIMPKAGDLLLFRSNLLHMVEKNKSQDNRVSIAMNFIFER